MKSLFPPVCINGKANDQLQGFKIIVKEGKVDCRLSVDRRLFQDMYNVIKSDWLSKGNVPGPISGILHITT